MAREYTITVNDRDYAGVTASAKDQFEAMHIAVRTGLVAALKDDKAADMSRVTLLCSMGMDDLRRLDKLLMDGKLERESDNVPVAFNLFGDEIQDYYLLMVGVIKENLGGFWKLRRQTDKPGATEPSR